jgi:hypothetical protein
MDRQRDDAINSAYLIEIKDNIHEVCTRAASRKFQRGGASEKARQLDLGQVRSGVAS